MRGLALSPDNNLYISNCWSHSILKLNKQTGDTHLLADRTYFWVTKTSPPPNEPLSDVFSKKQTFFSNICHLLLEKPSTFFESNLVYSPTEISSKHVFTRFERLIWEGKVFEWGRVVGKHLFPRFVVLTRQLSQKL